MTNELTDDELREAIVRHEWDQFQRTNNEGGRAACQGNWPVFHQMRLAQFLTWERPLLTSYAADLDAADHVGRNLVTEKYGRMMASTAPENFTKNIEPYIRVSLKSARPVRNRSSPSRSPGPRISASATPSSARRCAHSPPPKTHHLPPHSKPICAASLVRIPTRPSNVTKR